MAAVDIIQSSGNPVAAQFNGCGVKTHRTALPLILKSKHVEQSWHRSVVACDLCSEPLTDREVEALNEFGSSESPVSTIIGRSVSHIDVLLLFIELLKIEINSREQEKIGRRLERDAQVKHMLSMVDDFKWLGGSQRTTSIGAGIMGILAGALPIIGFTKLGDMIHGKLSNYILQGMEKKKFFDSLSKMVGQGAEINKNIGEVQKTFSEGRRALSQHLSDIHRADGEEETRTLDDILQNWRSIDQFMQHLLQTQHDVAKSLYY